ncbi:MAG TPA: hypothetical protein VEG84_09140, partial [Thermoanaerobaculia bacterium]|nr:hypothetical protein [Thermoanaerobaculia bacterium]
WGWTGRGGVYLSVHGVFPTRTVDFRGWNFAGAGGVGAAHMDVIAGARMAGRLGQTVAVSSRPVVVPARPGEGREAIQSFVRDAPRTVERTSTGDPGRLSPMLARERTLPASTVEEMRNRAVVVDRGRLTGPGVADIAPRGAPVDRTRSLDFRSSPASPAVRPATDRARDFSTTSASNQGIARSVPNRVESRTVVRGDQNGVETKSSAAAARDDWRQRSRSLDSQAMQQPPQAATSDRAADDWRSRSSVPPARRVIEGAVPGRRGYDSDRQLYRQTDPRDLRGGGAPAYRPDQAPRPAPRRDAPSSSHSAPAPHSAPHSTSHSSSPPHH